MESSGPDEAPIQLVLPTRRDDCARQCHCPTVSPQSRSTAINPFVWHCLGPHYMYALPCASSSFGRSPDAGIGSCIFRNAYWALRPALHFMGFKLGVEPVATLVRFD